MNLDQYYPMCVRMREEFLAASDQKFRDTLVRQFVRRLRAYGLSDQQIEEILAIEELNEAQGNKQMISNNQAYLLAVARALGRTK